MKRAHQIKPLHIIWGQIDNMSNWELSDARLTQSSHLIRDMRYYRQWSSYNYNAELLN